MCPGVRQAKREAPRDGDFTVEQETRRGAQTRTGGVSLPLDALGYGVAGDGQHPQ